MTTPVPPDSQGPDVDAADLKWTIRRADGFMDLAMWAQAERELDRVPRRSRHTPEVLQLYLRLSMAREDWADARESAIALTRLAPDEPAFWVQLAYCTRRAVDLDAAHRILTRAVRRFPNEAILAYNLGCYECCLGNREKAAQHLRRAFQLDEAYARLAVDDPDLASMQSELENLCPSEDEPTE